MKKIIFLPFFLFVGLFPLFGLAQQQQDLQNSQSSEDILREKQSRTSIISSFDAIGSYNNYFTKDERDTMSSDLKNNIGTKAMNDLFVCQADPNESEAVFMFTRDLQKGDSGPDVLVLQRILNKDPDTQVANPPDPGSPGHETNYFGDKTKIAVKKFQVKWSISPAVGYVGVLTREKLNTMLPDLGVSDVPIISSLVPNTGDFKQRVVIKGTGFTPIGNNICAEGGELLAKNVRSLKKGTKMVFFMPDFGAPTSLQIYIKNSNGISLTTPFDFNGTSDSPFIESLEPSSGPPGTLITIHGNGFDKKRTNEVVFGPQTSQPMKSKDTETLRFRVLNLPGMDCDAWADVGSKRMDLVVKNNDGISNRVSFKMTNPCDDFIPPPPTDGSFAITVTQTDGGTITPGTVNVPPGTNKVFIIAPDDGNTVDKLTVDGKDVKVGDIINGFTVKTLTRFVFLNVQANHTITATYIYDDSSGVGDCDPVLGCTITVTQSVGGTITPGTVTVAKGTDKTFTITPSTGNSIKTLTIDGNDVSVVNTYTFKNIQANHTVTATFQGTGPGMPCVNGLCMVYVETEGAGTITIDGWTGGGFSQGSDVSYTVQAIPPSEIEQVAVDSGELLLGPGQTTFSSSFSNIQANHTLYARFVDHSLVTITVNDPTPGFGNTISPGTITVPKGSSPNFSFGWGPGINSSEVFVDGISVGFHTNYTLSNVQEPHTISAIFYE